MAGRRHLLEERLGAVWPGGPRPLRNGNAHAVSTPRANSPMPADSTVSCIKRMAASPRRNDESVQTNRPNSSRLIASHCPWSAVAARSNNQSNRRSGTATSARKTAQSHHICARLGNSRKRAQTGSDIFIPIACRQTKSPARSDSARRRRCASASTPGDMQAEPVTGHGDSSGTPTPHEGARRTGRQ